MKKILGLLMVASNILLAQNSDAVFSTKELIWFGLDFTNAKFVGQFDQGMGAMPATGTDMKNKYIPDWNSLIVNESQNFDFRKAFNKETILFDINSVNELNKKIDAGACMDINPTKIDYKVIDGMVKKYSPKLKKEGIGFSFIVENFNKGTQTATIYVTFFDIASRKVLLCKSIEGKAAGVGIRNYWAGSIKAILKKLKSGEFKSWK